MTLFKPFQLNFSDPILFALNLYLAFVYAVLYSWFEAFPLVYEQVSSFRLERRFSSVTNYPLPADVWHVVAHRAVTVRGSLGRIPGRSCWIHPVAQVSSMLANDAAKVNHT